MSNFLKKECNLKYFHNNNYFRKKCKKCGAYYWTLDKDSELCGDQPCVKFSFIKKPLGKKSFTLSDVRESFLTFFEKNNHTRLNYPETGERCPVVARWRTDIYLTIASIADFQPHVTSGKVPAPANPLVISQPCIRLNDLEEVGVSGRHLTTFEMMGHHAFNKNNDEIYFKEKTVRLCDKYFTEYIGIPREKINYKEQLWFGGGNAGPCLEVLASGLEIATLVFMNMKEDKNGDFEIEGKKYSKNPLNIVDTGYGLERIAWITKGTETIYESVFPEIIDWIKKHCKYKKNMSDIYSLADHSKCLSFMLGDGIVPSNVKSGYLARLIIRRSLRFIDQIKLDKSLRDIVELHLDLLEKKFPSLKENKKQIGEILDIESKRYFDTLDKGKNLVKRILSEKKTIDEKELITLYDTHGMPPEIVKKISLENGVDVNIPNNFESMVAELHSHQDKEETCKEKIEELPETEPLYYKNHYTKEFNAKVLRVKIVKNYSEVVLDKTAFYPEGGGQPSDIGFLEKNGKRYKVKNVKKVNDSIVHLVKGKLEKNDNVKGKIDWDHRYNLMKHHTGTHVVNGALRKVLGKHVWQAGSQLNIQDARFDYSHYKLLSEKEIKKIERTANEFVKQKVDVEKKIMDRNSAEKTYGFRLYQGGVPPGNKIRVLDIPGIDVEACGGTHLDNIGEIEKIRIIKSERIQDGVNRIIFAAGKMADLYKAKEKETYNEIVDLLKPFFEIKEHENISNQLKEVSKTFSVQIDQLDKTIKRFLKETEIKQKIKVENLKTACEKLFNKWKKTQKEKKKVSSDEIQDLLEKAEKISDGTKIITAITSNDAVSVAGKLVKKEKIVAHIYDGKKLVSIASKDIDIDLRKIAPIIGKVLGGSGGGKTHMTQCGGPNKNRVNEALKKAKNLTKERLV